MKQIYILENNTKYMNGHHVTVNNRICFVCGDHFKHIPYMVDNNACSTCQYWYEKWQQRNDPASVRVDGVQYMLNYNQGLFAHIQMNDGRRIVTSNLWHNGTIPVVWVILGLEDNARFVE
jgi:hypothetical protein